MPSDWGEGEGLVSTACACAVIIQILNNPITSTVRLYTFTDTFTVKYTENVAHAHAVDTRPSFPLPPIRRPGDEANYCDNTQLSITSWCDVAMLYCC